MPIIPDPFEARFAALKALVVLQTQRVDAFESSVKSDWSSLEARLKAIETAIGSYEQTGLSWWSKLKSFFGKL